MLILLLVGIFHVRVPLAHANTINVPADQPSIQAAIDSAGPGDTIRVSPGTYHEDIVIKSPLVQVVGASRDTTIIDGQGGGIIVWINASSVEFTGFTVRNSQRYGWGIHVEQATNVNITSDAISTNSGDGEGVNLSGVSTAIVEGNVFSDNLYGVNVTNSNHVRVTNNQAVSNDTIGVQLKGSTQCLVFNNSFQSGEDGIDILESSFNNSITRNLIKDMTIDGIALQTDSNRSPVPQFPQNNTINENTFARNHIGVNLQNETLNTFYHNDFFQSIFRQVNPVENSASFFVIVKPNTWDNSSLGGLVGGNFWDDYSGVDANGDGIGDTPYVIGRENQDSRPLMAPFGPEPVLIQSIRATPSGGVAPLSVIFSSTVTGSLTPFSYSWNFGDGSLAFSVNPQHEFARAGNYTVSLTVRDSSGSTDNRVILVRVTAPQQASYPVWIIVGAVAGLLVAALLVWTRRRRKRARLRMRN